MLQFLFSCREEGGTSRLALRVPSAWGIPGHSVRCTVMAHTVRMWCQSRVTMTKLVAGLFDSPKMSRVAILPLTAAASQSDFE